MADTARGDGDIVVDAGEHRGGMVAVKAAPGSQKLRMWDRDGASFEVNGDDEAAYWEAKGFRRTKFDPRELASELIQMLGATAKSIKEWVDGVVDDGAIDTSDGAAGATVEQAMGRVNQLYSQLYADIGTFPVAQGEHKEPIKK